MATDPERTGSDLDLTAFLRIWIGSGSSFIKRCGSGSELGFAPQIIWGQNQHYILQRSFFLLVSTGILAEKTPLFTFWYSPEFGQKKRPCFSKDLIFFDLHLNLSRKNAQILNEDLFCFSLVYFWFSLI